jgi:hypothetical protein
VKRWHKATDTVIYHRSWYIHILRHELTADGSFVSEVWRSIVSKQEIKNKE